MPNLNPNFNKFNSETAKLLRLCTELRNLSPQYQKFVAEIILLRLCGIQEENIESMCCKLLCGATFIDNSLPNLLVNARSLADADFMMKTHARLKAKNRLNWNKGKEIKINLKYVFHSTDHVLSVIDRNRIFIDEIRRIRNRVAHNSSQCRTEYKEVVRRHYGASLNHITPGTLLLTNRMSPCLLEQYITTSRILMRDITKA